MTTGEWSQILLDTQAGTYVLTPETALKIDQALREGFEVEPTGLTLQVWAFTNHEIHSPDTQIEQALKLAGCYGQTVCFTYGRDDVLAYVGAYRVYAGPHNEKRMAFAIAKRLWHTQSRGEKYGTH